MIRSTIFWAAWLLIMPSMASAQVSQPVLASPVAGDVITSGEPVNLKWLSNRNEPGQVKLSFWNQGTGQWSNIGYADSKSGSFKWDVPNYYGNNFRLRAIFEDGSIAYTSGFFSIVPPAPKVEAAIPGVTTAIDMTVHPNPTSRQTRICVLDLPAEIPANVEVVNEDGTTVAALYNATPDAELGLCLTWDCSQVPSGIYYAHIANSIMGRAVKISVQH